MVNNLGRNDTKRKGATDKGCRQQLKKVLNHDDCLEIMTKTALQSSTGNTGCDALREYIVVPLRLIMSKRYKIQGIQMILTERYIKEHATAKGGWTKKQIEALGLSWPTEKGWIERLIGTEISETQRLAFEDGKGVKAKRAPKTIEQQVSHMSHDALVNLLGLVYKELKRRNS